MDSKKIELACKKARLPRHVPKPLFKKLSREINTVSEMSDKKELTKRVIAISNELNQLLKAGKNKDWKASDELGGSKKINGGVIHCSFNDLFTYLCSDVEYLLPSLELTLSKFENLYSVGVEYDHEAQFFKTIHVKQESFADKIKSPNILIAGRTKSGQMIIESNEIMLLLGFWLKFGGKAAFSASSKFTLFCSELLNVSPKALESRFSNMNLPQQCRLLFSDVRENAQRT
ncbi:hypothetical protein PYE51_10420 [Vibrio aestuarianus]|uniref:Uncharacterized protein n=1 Tax=Vibrio aestuarianus TaxID=28171 RepID=A0AAX3U2H5_9VIBR|nr:hypothetical protein [Vibrio aestuarianus]WGK81038.1 hypothetical protein PYE51_10420 [Vibrio aestuarianus]